MGLWGGNDVALVQDMIDYCWK